MKRLTEQQIAKICFNANPLKATANYPRCPYPRTTLKTTISAITK
tara:strand:- start:196 stop:330 length:135 start_codon:yes stop_codon:yes gene_type:complete